MLDDGRLSDNQGHTVDFTNTIVVMTSNIGSQLIQEIAREGGSEEEMREAVTEVARSRGSCPSSSTASTRRSSSIRSAPSRSTRSSSLQINRLQKQLAEKHLELEVTEAAIDAIARQGYDPTYGARPLKRVIQQQIQNPLAIELLKRNLADGGHVKVDCQDGEFTFEWLDSPAAQPAAV